jgi:hypothetical protein
LSNSQKLHLNIRVIPTGCKSTQAKANEKIGRQITISLLTVLKPAQPGEVRIASKDPADSDIAAGQVLRRSRRHETCKIGNSRTFLKLRGRLRVYYQQRKGIGKHSLN